MKVPRFLLKTVLNLASQNDEISVVSDQIGAPTYSDDISRVIATILPFIKNKNITRNSTSIHT